MSGKQDDKSIKCLVIGDGGIGKTTLIMRYCIGSMPPDYYSLPHATIPVYEESLVPTLHTIDGVHVKLVIFDTGGGEDYDRLRPLGYPETDIFMICFSVVDPASFERVRKHYAPEVACLNPDTPVLLVGTKVDLRDSHAGTSRRSYTSAAVTRTGGAHLITHHDGIDLRDEIKAAAYMECSALTGFNVTAVFDRAMRLACPIFNTISKKKRLNLGCIIA